MSPTVAAASPIVPVILSGGSGTRLWPLSREAHPKQLLALTGPETMLQQTARRAARLAPPVVVCSDAHRFLIAEQLRQIGVPPAALVIEPVGRNTAPAVACAALMLAEQDPQARLLVLPSDHAVRDGAAFTAAVERAAACEADLVCFGVPATRPHTGYGYVEQGAALGEGVHRVARFTEKPDLATAEGFVAGGRHAWNAGIFLFRAGRYLAELERLRPDMLALCRAAVAQARVDLDFVRLAPEPFTAIAGESVDYAVMEQVDDAVVVTLDAGWSDIGSWSALHEHSDRDGDGNTLVGDVLAVDCRDSYVRSDKPLVATLGLSNVMVVATDDAVLVADAGRDQEVKALVERLHADGRREAGSHSRVYRPWGWFQSIDTGPRFQVKHILVKAGESISLQLHYHRSEHWIVVEGTAEVTRGDDTFLVRENESTYIKAGVVHRLHNPGRLPLRLIEVQSGAYLGEDDIIRLEDAYGRLPSGLLDSPAKATGE